MGFEEMNFKRIREESRGYIVIFDDNKPVGYGYEVSPVGFDDEIEEQNYIDDMRDELYSDSSMLCIGADGLTYKVVGDKHTRGKAWARAELIPDRGERLRAFRGGMTLQALAEKSGFAVQTLSRFEKGGRDIRNASGETLLRLSEALGVAIEELIK